jgi:hypothetical protein
MFTSIAAGSLWYVMLSNEDDGDGPTGVRRLGDHDLVMIMLVSWIAAAFGPMHDPRDEEDRDEWRQKRQNAK